MLNLSLRWLQQIQRDLTRFINQRITCHPKLRRLLGAHLNVKTAS